MLNTTTTQSVRSLKFAEAFLWLIVVTFAGIISFGCADSISSSDTLPPTVALYSPVTNDTIYQREYEIIYDAYDDQGLAYVELYVNSAMIKRFSATAEGARPAVKWTPGASLLGTRISYYLLVADLGGNVVTTPTMTDILVAAQPSLPPTAPYGLSVLKISDNPYTINIRWSDSSTNVVKYEMYRAVGASDPSSFVLYRELAGTARNTNDVIADPTVLYYYKLKTVNNIGTSVFSAIVNSKGSSASSVNPPDDLSGTPVGTKKVRLKWTNRDVKVNFIKVQRKTVDALNFTDLKIIAPSATEYLDESSGIFSGGTYNYRLIVYSSSDSAISNEVQVTIGQYNLLAPSGLVATELRPPTVTQNTIRLNWNDNSIEELNYYIERKLGEAGNWTERQVLSSDAVTFDDTMMPTTQTRIFYRVRCGRGGEFSEYSNIAEIVYNP